jgi:hypothetical protein
MISILQNVLKALGGGLILYLLEKFFQTTFLSDYLRANLITILFALLAINAATLGVVLTKLRDLVDREGKKDAFKGTQKEMLLSVNEQVALIIISTILLMAEKSPLVADKSNALLAINILIPSCLTYALAVLYDTCKSVFVLLDFSDKN